MTKNRQVKRRGAGRGALVCALALCVLLSGCAGWGQNSTEGSSPASGSVVAGSSIPQTGQEAMAFLEGSLRPYDKGVEFTLPEGWPGEDWNIHISGRAAMGDGGMSIHLMEKENAAKAWQAGKTYQIECAQGYLDLNLSACLYSDEEQELSVDLLALAQGQPQPQAPAAPESEPAESIPESASEQDMTQRVSATFPAYQEGRSEYNGEYYDQAPFTASFLLPQGWSLKEPEKADRVFDQGMNTQLLVCDSTGRAAGSIGYGLIETAEPGNEPEAGEEYKLVYCYLRTPSSCYWEDYRAVKKTAAGENAVATVYFGEGEPGYAAEERTAHGALAYDKELGVYVALRMEEDSPLNADQVETLAQSLTLAAVA